MRQLGNLLRTLSDARRHQSPIAEVRAMRAGISRDATLSDWRGSAKSWQSHSIILYMPKQQQKMFCYKSMLNTYKLKMRK